MNAVSHMNQEQADSEMRALLDERRFNFDQPSLPIAWSAFTEFVRHPLEGLDTDTFGVEISQFDDRDDVLWVSFMRRVQEPDGSGWSCGCLLSCTTPRELVGVQESCWWWAEHGTIEQWISDVERKRAFAAVTTLNGWNWEGFSE